MDRITGATTVDIGGGRRGFRSKDTVAGQPGTVVTAAHMNAMQEEFLAAIERSLLVPSAGDLTQLAKAMRSQRMNWLGLATGTANAITLTPQMAFATLGELLGVPLRFVAAAANTGAVTLAVNGLAATAVVGRNGQALRSGVIQPGSIISVIFDGIRFVVTDAENSRWAALPGARGMLTVDPVALIGEVDGIRHFNTLAAARAMINTMALSINDRAHVTVYPGALQPADPIICVPWVSWDAVDTHTVLVKHGSVDGALRMANASNVKGFVIEGSPTRAHWSIVGNNVVGCAIDVDVLSDPTTPGDFVSQGVARAGCIRLTGNSVNWFFDGTYDADHATAEPGILVDLLGNEADGHFGYRRRFFYDALHMQNGWAMHFNRASGIVLWSPTIRACRELGVQGGFNTGPLRLTHFMPDGVTLAPGTSLTILLGGELDGAPIHIGAKCSLVVKAGATFPGVSLDSRGDLVLYMSDNYTVTRPGIGRFVWRNQGTAALDSDFVWNAAGRVTLSSPGRGPSPSMSVLEEVNKIPGGATAWSIVAGLTNTNVAMKAGNRSGVTLVEQSSGRVVFFGAINGDQIAVQHMLTATSAPTTIATLPCTEREFSIRISVIGGVRKYEVSARGDFYTTVHTEGAGIHLTANNIGVGIDSANAVGPNFDVGLTISDWFFWSLP